MCGILGEVRAVSSPQGGGRLRIQPLLGYLQHRGPDGEGIWEDEHVTLAHRRLSIIDLTTTASQPMEDADSGVVLVFNGEIYNYLEIRQELKTGGHVFRGSGDAEVLLRGYLEWGEGVLDQLNGMFAFAIWDPRSRTLFGARDPAGQKPFFYSMGSHGFVFGSELATLAKHPWISKTIDPAGLAQFLAYDHTPAPGTILRGVFKLPPGQAIRYRPGQGGLKAFTYRDLASKNPVRLAKSASPGPADFEQLEQAMQNSVARHIRSDVPVGAFLSGGIDSTLLCFLASRLLGRNLSTFTVRFSDASYNEADEALATARALGTTHYEKIISEEHAIHHIPEFIKTIDEPLADLGLLALREVVEFAAEKVKVVLSGDGGDELFYGYEPFLKWNASELLNRLPRFFVERGLKPFAQKRAGQFGYMEFFYKMHLFLRGYGLPASIRNSAWVGGFLPPEICQILRPEVLVQVGNTEAVSGQVYEPLFRLFEESRDLPPLDRLGVEYQKTYLPGVICAHTDKATMASSIEGRSPFLDEEVVNFANAIPWEWKIRGGRGKWILRAYLAKKLAKSPIAYLPKHGYSVPMARWLRSNLSGFAKEVLSGTFQDKLGFFNPGQIEKLFQEHLQGKMNHAKQLWPLIVFSCWAEKQGLRA